MAQKIKPLGDHILVEPVEEKETKKGGIIIGDWLDKAIRIVEKQIREMNQKQRGKQESEVALVE